MRSQPTPFEMRQDREGPYLADVVGFRVDLTNVHNQIGIAAAFHRVHELENKLADAEAENAVLIGDEDRGLCLHSGEEFCNRAENAIGLLKLKNHNLTTLLADSF